MLYIIYILYKTLYYNIIFDDNISFKNKNWWLIIINKYNVPMSIMSNNVLCVNHVFYQVTIKHKQQQCVSVLTLRIVLSVGLMADSRHGACVCIKATGKVDTSHVQLSRDTQKHHRASKTMRTDSSAVPHSNAETDLNTTLHRLSLFMWQMVQTFCAKLSV